MMHRVSKSKRDLKLRHRGATSARLARYTTSAVLVRSITSRCPCALEPLDWPRPETSSKCTTALLGHLGDRLQSHQISFRIEGGHAAETGGSHRLAIHIV